MSQWLNISTDQKSPHFSDYGATGITGEEIGFFELGGGPEATIGPTSNGFTLAVLGNGSIKTVVSPTNDFTLVSSTIPVSPLVVPETIFLKRETTYITITTARSSTPQTLSVKYWFAPSTSDGFLPLLTGHTIDIPDTIKINDVYTNSSIGGNGAVVPAGSRLVCVVSFATDDNTKGDPITGFIVNGVSYRGA